MAVKFQINPDFLLLEKYFPNPPFTHTVFRAGLNFYRLGDTQLESEIESWNRHITEYQHGIKKLLQLYNISLSHLDNFCLISLMIAGWSEEGLNDWQVIAKKEWKQLKQVYDALENYHLLAIKLRFYNNEVIIDSKALIAKFKRVINDEILGDHYKNYFKESLKDSLKNYSPHKKYRKAAVAYQVNVANSISTYLLEELLLKIKASNKLNVQTAYSFTGEFFRTINRPLNYAEGRKKGQKVPPEEYNDYLKDRLR